MHVFVYTTGQIRAIYEYTEYQGEMKDCDCRWCNPLFVMSVRLYLFARNSLEMTGFDAVNEDGELPKIAQLELQQTSFSTAIFENLPMLLAKFAEMIETKNTISSFWALSIINAFISIISSASRYSSSETPKEIKDYFNARDNY